MALAINLALAGQHPWSGLSTAERSALAPLASDWNLFPGVQQERLLAVARHYPTLSPQQQLLLQKRLRAWSRLTPEQRQAARQNLSRIQTLPAEDQAKIKQRWLDALCKEFSPPGGDAPAK
ncbi:MAG: DUF3106 domain-containing protein [Thiobacillus sp.]|nr:DUF3106 domain-containing protein [Thiobacillus sp.]